MGGDEGEGLEVMRGEGLEVRRCEGLEVMIEG